MWFRFLFDALNRDPSRTTIRRRPPLRGRARHDAVRCREARRLLLESLGDRSLMAFNVLTNYATLTNPDDMQLTHIDGNSTLDMVVLNSDAISVRLGNADGSVGPAHNTAAGNGVRASGA